MYPYSLSRFPLPALPPNLATLVMTDFDDIGDGTVNVKCREEGEEKRIAAQWN